MSKHKIKVEALLESSKFIQIFKDSLMVVKLGGSALYDSEAKTSLISDICFLRAIGIRVVVVHGGGKEVSDMLLRLGMETKFINGYRYTSEADIGIVEMVLSGKVNKDLVSEISKGGFKAVGLSGKDGDMLTLERRILEDGTDLGYVGTVVHVDTKLILDLLEKAYVPVISSLGCGYDGETLNLNADEVASAIANELKAKKLIYLTDVDGIIIDSELCSELDLKESVELEIGGKITGGMIPKLDYSISSIRAGVEAVHIINGTSPHSILLELFTDQGVGTKITYTRRKRV